MDQFVLVLTGPPGAGKTSVLEALSDELVVADLRHATVETEALTSAHPALDDVRWLAPVRAVCALYRDFGYPVLLVTATLESDAHRRGLIEAIGADELAVVRLEADPATLRRRIVEREPAGWSGLAGLVEAAPRLSAVIAGLDGVDLALSTEGRRPEAVAERIRERWPERLSRPGAARR